MYALTDQSNLLSVLLLKWFDNYNTDISHTPFLPLNHLSNLLIPSTTSLMISTSVSSNYWTFLSLYQLQQHLQYWFGIVLSYSKNGVNKHNFYLWTSRSFYFSLLPRLHPPSPPFSTEFWSLLRWHGCWMFWKSFLTTMATPTFVWMEPLLSRRDRYTAVHVLLLLSTSSECNMMQTLWCLG